MVADGAVRMALPTALDSSVTGVEMSTGKGHLAGRVWFRAKDKVLESRFGLIALNSQTAVDKPLPHCSKGIVIEGVHGIIATKARRVSVGVQAFPNGCRTLRPVSLSTLLIQAVVMKPVISE